MAAPRVPGNYHQSPRDVKILVRLGWVESLALGPAKAVALIGRHPGNRNHHEFEVHRPGNRSGQLTLDTSGCIPVWCHASLQRRGHAQILPVPPDVFIQELSTDSDRFLLQHLGGNLALPGFVDGLRQEDRKWGGQHQIT